MDELKEALDGPDLANGVALSDIADALRPRPEFRQR